MTKWKRLYNAFATIQNQERIGNRVIMFINRAMDPANYTNNPVVFSNRQGSLNSVLAFSNMIIGDDGKVRRAPAVNNLDDALARANRLRKELERRNVHSDVLAYCRIEIIQNNYFHAVLEAMKSIAAKIRQFSGLTIDGAELVQQAFGMAGGKRPFLAINALSTETDRGEQRGLMKLLIGLFGTIRNPTAHNPKIEWNMLEQDALDILTMTSLIHRKLDQIKINI